MIRDFKFKSMLRNGIQYNKEFNLSLDYYNITEKRNILRSKLDLGPNEKSNAIQI